MAEIRELKPDQLKALSHPLRVAILKTLRIHGPATASALGRRLGESSGATSYHLRQLEKHGFVEEVPDSGDGRDRWWRPAFDGHRVEATPYLGSPEGLTVLGVYEQQVVATHAQSASQFVSELSAGEWSDEWAEAHSFNDFRLRLSPARTQRLAERIQKLLESYGEDDDGEEVVVQFAAFPITKRPFA